MCIVVLARRLDSAGAVAWRVWIPAWGAGFIHQRLEGIALLVQHRGDVLTSVNDSIEGVAEDLVDLAAALT